MLLQPPGLPRQDSESLKLVQERWRPLRRDRTHERSGEGWVESDQLRWPQERWREMDARSFCYNFTVNPQPSPGELWCVVQGQVDGNVFLSYDCTGAMIQSTSPLGEEVKTMNTWETQRETLRDIGDFLTGQLPDNITEKPMARVVQWKEQALEERNGPDYLGPGEVDMVRQRIRQVQSLSSFISLVGSDPLTLQGRMTCWCEEDGRISGSWQFGFSGEMCLRFDSEDGHWTVDHSGGRRIEEKWAKDRAVTDFFKKVSMETVGPGLGSLWCTGRKY
ncbi:hypothetical protein MG293_010564 [Ovis ammon polii]|uniref:MHC class I-like antigen recognition-like domain-containing protein n=1 Tax=Ovis ammon polii TaxID=230172 RepID=A0AAD4Y9L3_OVIAM|nr:hypothetical protein MG293_010564 [Ovis ammon polii]